MHVRTEARRLLRFCAAAALLAFTTTRANAQTCACAPQMKDGYGNVATFSVLFNQGFDATDLAALKYGMNLWNNWFSSQGEPAMFNVVTYGPAQITVGIDPSMSGAGPLARNENYPSGAAIFLNPDYLGKGMSGLLINIGGHEFGHSVGFADVRLSSCSTSTIMYKDVSPSGPYITSLKSCDKAALGAEYPSPGSTPTPDPIPPSGGYTPPPYDPCCSPVLIGYGQTLRMSGLDNGVLFDIDADGRLDYIGWPSAGATMAFLVLDRNHNGRIDDGRELFGTATGTPSGAGTNGFAALEQFDCNSDGVIDRRDAIWTELALWFDANHDGITDAGEIVPLNSSGVTEIDLAYHFTGRRDANGNYYRYESLIHIGRQTQPAYDVYFVRSP
jgi:hypothetical protein